jgi:hypothetical protein
MPDMEESRLGRLMDERRLNLGLDWQDVASLAGISTKTLYNARVPGAPLPAPRTRRKIEDALRWKPGSMERAYGGGDPEALPPAARTVPPAPRNPFAFAAEWGDEPEDDPAWKVFPNPADRLFRMIWRRPIPFEDRERKVGELRDAIRRALDPPGEESTGLYVPVCKDLVT